MTIEVPPELETALAAAAESRGLSVDALVRQLLAAFARSTNPESVDAWDAGIEEALDTMPPLPVLPLTALSRESMYDDAG